MHVYIFNACLLIGWLLVLVGGCLVSLGWGMACAGACLVALALVSARVAGGIYLPDKKAA